MKEEYKEKWVEALRSGEYTQCHASLFNGVGHCCLGVLCRVVGLEPNKLYFPVGDPDWGFDGAKGFPPKSVHDKTYLEYQSTAVLAAMNDDDRATFDQIADYIEENWQSL